MKRDFFKQKVILFFGYNGQRYHGLQNQKNSDVLTVESKLYQALFDSVYIAYHRIKNLVGKATFGELHQTGWSRGARTDKGVHALCNSVALKMWITKDFLVQNEEDKQVIEPAPTLIEQIQQTGPVDENVKVRGNRVDLFLVKFDKNKDKYSIDFMKVIALLNSNLPDDMKVYACKLTTQLFDVRKSARCRLYEYVLPVCVYQNLEDIKLNKEPTEEFRQQVLERLQGVVKKFEGSHNFHNYSRGLKSKDPSANRYIIKMEVVPVEYKGVHFFRFLLVGQSFVYHQIRKMIGMTIQLYQEQLPGIKNLYEPIDTFVDNSFFSNQLRVMLAPPEGLFLNRINFDSYNKKGDIPQTLTLNAEEELRLENFRPIIESHIFDQELNGKVFSKWMIDTLEKGIMAEEESEDKGHGVEE